MYRSGERHREFGVRAGRYAGSAITLATRDLPHETRARLSACLVARRPAAPIASSGPPRRSPRAAFAVLVVGLFVLVRAAEDGFGDAWNANAIEPRWMGALYGVALAAIVLSARSLFTSLAREGWTPLPLGRHLLPLDLVDVRPGTITIRPFGDAREVRVDEEARRVRIFYADSALEEIVAAPATKNEPSLWVRMLNAQHDLEEATHGGGAKSDPFEALRGDDGFAEDWRKRAVDPAPMPKAPSRAIVLVVLAASLGIGLSGVVARNHASDDAMFATARATNLTSSYKRYLEAGGVRHASEVRATLLPRAALDEAAGRRDGNIHALRAFLRDYPGSSVDAEAHARFDAACREQLAHAVTLESLRMFEDGWPDCHLEGEIAPARVRLHEALLDRDTARGIGAIRDYVRRYPDSPVSDRAVKALRTAFQDVRAKVRADVDRPELRDALLDLVDRSEAAGMPVTFFVPMTLETELDMSEETRRHVMSAFDRALTAVLDPSIAYVYHPASLANVDVARSSVLRVEATSYFDDAFVHVSFELATAGRKTTWTATVNHARADVLGASLARRAISSRPE